MLWLWKAQVLMRLLALAGRILPGRMATEAARLSFTVAARQLRGRPTPMLKVARWAGKWILISALVGGACA